MCIIFSLQKNSIVSMSIFQKSIVKKHISSINQDLLKEKWNLFTSYFHNATIQENIHNSKEEQFQEGFLRELFVKVLGYTLNPEPNFNLTTEYKNIKDSKKADGAIIINNIVTAVIELKGTGTTDLGKVESQAFNYKNNQHQCVYVITSNFEKLRFYIDNAIEHIEFNLFKLTEEEFQLLYLCLAFKNIENNVPKNIKDESVSQEDVITKKLYNDYSLFKRELHHNLVALNPSNDPLELFQKSQKLLDRFLFIFFSEDRGLLPTNLIFRINKEWQQLREMRIDVSLYDRYKIYFSDLNVGAKVSLPAFSQTASNKKDEFQIYAYNGGLFKEDDELNTLKIDDALLFKHTEKLSNYDFASEVDVNILGHIFENSLNELDEIKAQIEGQEIDKTKTKRKKDGVFYTPKYITKYIVDNTVGKLCNDKKVELKIIEEDYITDKKRNKTTIQNLAAKLSDYRNWLLQITICDPACGSGAFLNQALDFLINEHKYIDELQAKLFGDALILSDVEQSILENNIFGVDINEESAEIAKLSLWLRTAQPNRKLNDLNSNIKCGNSLIDDVKVAGAKAFNWTNEFKEVFENGGFDIIIGNPPYVQHRRLTEFSDFLKTNYGVYTGTSDLSVYFYEKGIDILKDNGILAYISTNKYFNSEYGKQLRDYLVKYQITTIINFEQVAIFKDALVSSTINIFQKRQFDQQTKYIEFKNEKLDADLFQIELQKRSRLIEKEYLENNSWLFENDLIGEIVNKIKSKGKLLGEISNIEIKRGITTGFDDAFIVNRESDLSTQNKQISKKLLRGRDIGRYSLSNSQLNLLFIPWHFPLHEDISISGASHAAENALKSQNLPLYEHLLSFKDKLSSRNKSETGITYEWYALQRCAASYYQLFEKEKIVWGLITGNWGFSLDRDGHYLTSASFFLTSDEINLSFLEVLLNSKLYKFYFEHVGELTAGGAYVLKKTSVEKFVYPTGLSNDIQKVFINNANLMISLNNELQEQCKKVQRSLERKFSLKDLPKKLEMFYLLSYTEFIKELGKKKIRLSVSEESEWEEYFITESKKALELKSRIDITDKEIDQMVYKLYDLTEDEIKIVEG